MTVPYPTDILYAEAEAPGVLRKPLAGVSIYVLKQDGTPEALTDANGSPVAQPYRTPATGLVAFSVPSPGAVYDVEYRYGGKQLRRDTVIVGDPPEFKGDPGDKGDTGDKGDRGPQGVPATIAVGAVTTGAPGSSASVSNNGSGSAAVLAFSIPQGLKGDKGDKGDQGNPGTGLTNRYAWASGTTYNPNDYAFDPDANGVSTLWIVQASSSFTSTTNPRNDPTRWVGYQAPKGDKGDKGDTGPAPTPQLVTVQPSIVIGTSDQAPSADYVDSWARVALGRVDFQISAIFRDRSYPNGSPAVSGLPFAADGPMPWPLQLRSTGLPEGTRAFIQGDSISFETADGPIDWKDMADTWSFTVSGSVPVQL